MRVFIYGRRSLLTACYRDRLRAQEMLKKCVLCMLSDPAMARCGMVNFNRRISYPWFTALFIYTFSVTKEPLRGLVRLQTCELSRRGNKTSMCQKWCWSSSWIKAGRFDPLTSLPCRLFHTIFNIMTQLAHSHRII